MSVINVFTGEFSEETTTVVDVCTNIERIGGIFLFVFLVIQTLLHPAICIHIRRHAFYFQKLAIL